MLKVLGIPFSEMNKLAQLIPSKPGTKLKDALDESIEFRQAYDEDDRYKKVIDNALKLEGSIRQLGVHACAVIIAPRPMTDYCPLQHPPKDTTTTVTQFSAKPRRSRAFKNGLPRTPKSYHHRTLFKDCKKCS